MAESTSNSTDPSVRPFSSPFYIGFSYNPSSILVTNVFNGVGFTTWRRSMIIALSTNNKLGFIDGSISQPDPNSSSYSNRYRANSMVIIWLLNSLLRTLRTMCSFFRKLMRFGKNSIKYMSNPVVLWFIKFSNNSIQLHKDRMISPHIIQNWWRYGMHFELYKISRYIHVVLQQQCIDFLMTRDWFNF